MLDLYTVSVIIFAALLALFFFFDRKNVKRQSILLLRKTSFGKELLTRLGKRFPRVWWVYGMAAVVVGFAVSGYVFIWFIQMTLQNLTAEKAPGLALVLPSPTQDTVAAPGLIGVPFWYWIISIFLLILVHEGSHGLMAAREKVRIKSLGWGLFAVIPLAFVEPDEKQLAKEKPAKQLRVFAAGSFGNFLLAIIAGNLLIMLIVSGFAPSGVAFQGYIPGYPAEAANLTGSIVQINNYSIESVADLSRSLDEIGPGNEVLIKTRSWTSGSYEEASFSLVTARDNESGGGFIGIAGVSQDFVLKEGSPSPDAVLFLAGQPPSFFGLLFFIFLINLGVGAFNLMPIGPLDGGRMWRIILDKGVPRHSKRIMETLSWFLLALLILNFTTGFL